MKLFTQKNQNQMAYFNTMWCLCAWLLLLMACRTPKQHFFIKKTLNYWEGEYNGAKVWFKVLYAAEEDAYRRFYAAFILDKNGCSNILKLDMTAIGQFHIPMNERDFVGWTVPDMRFEHIEFTDSTLGADLTLRFEIEKFDPFVLAISNRSFGIDDSTAMHPNAADFIDVFPINRGQTHRITMTEKTISMQRIRDVYYKMLGF